METTSSAPLTPDKTGKQSLAGGVFFFLAENCFFPFFQASRDLEQHDCQF